MVGIRYKLLAKWKLKPCDPGEDTHKFPAKCEPKPWGHGRDAAQISNRMEVETHQFPTKWMLKPWSAGGDIAQISSKMEAEALGPWRGYRTNFQQMKVAALLDQGPELQQNESSNCVSSAQISNKVEAESLELRKGHSTNFQQSGS